MRWDGRKLRRDVKWNTLGQNITEPTIVSFRVIRYEIFFLLVNRETRANRVDGVDRVVDVVSREIVIDTWKK